jgi:hypothetical protein
MLQIGKIVSGMFLERRSLDAPRVHLLGAPWLLAELGPREWRSSSNTNPIPPGLRFSVGPVAQGVVSWIGLYVIVACGIGTNRQRIAQF